MSKLPKKTRGHGFTLVEAVIVIVLIGILSAIVAVFIRAPVQGYADSVGRAELTDQADLAMQRMARDLRLALPNSISVNAGQNAIEFMLTRGGGRYLAADDGSSTGFPLDFVDESKKEFSVVGAMPSLSTRVAPGDYVVVSNLGRGLAPNDAYQYGANQSNIARIDAGGVVTDGDGFVTSIKLADNPFGRQDPPMPSEDRRFQVVSGPVSYVCAADGKGAFTLSRHSGYPIVPAQAVPPAGATRVATLATRLATCDHLFRYELGAGQVGLVIITLSLKARNESDPSIRLVHQVHVDNTP